MNDDGEPRPNELRASSKIPPPPVQPGAPSESLEVAPEELPRLQDVEAALPAEILSDGDSQGDDESDGQFDDWTPYVSETETPLEYNIPTILVITTAAALLFAIERLIAGGEISVGAMLTNALTPIVITYFVSLDRRMAVNMLIALYLGALLCRVTGWTSLHSFSFLFGIVMLVYTGAVRFGSAVRIDLHYPLLGIPIVLVFMGSVMYGQFGEFGSFNLFTLVFAVTAVLSFMIAVIYRLMGLH